MRSLYQPLSVILPLAAVSDNDDDSVDNLETVRAIMKRFSTYGEGMFELLYALNFEFLFRILVIVFYLNGNDANLRRFFILKLICFELYSLFYGTPTNVQDK